MLEESNESKMLKLRRKLKNLKYKLNKFDASVRKYDIVIVGEEHINSECMKKEYELIQKLEPSVIFFEGGDIPPIDVITPETIEKESGVSVENKDPIYFWDEDSFNNVINELEEKIDAFYKEIDMKKTGNSQNEIQRRKSEIEKYVSLSDKLANISMSFLLTPDYRTSLMLGDLSAKLDINVRNMDDNETKEEFLKQLKTSDFENGIYPDEKERLHKEREKYMAHEISSYLNSHKSSDKPIMAIVGEYHAGSLKELLNDKYSVKVIDATEPEDPTKRIINGFLYTNYLINRLSEK